MTQLRLNNLMTLNVHKEALDGMNLVEVGDEFISHSRQTVWVTKKFPFFIKQRPCNGNFAFRFRVRSVVKVSVFFLRFLAWQF